MTPNDMYRNTGRWIPPAILAFVIICVVILAGWQVGWWFNAHNVQRGYSTTVQSQAYQTSLDAEMSQNISNINGLAITRTEMPQNSLEQQTVRAQQLSQIGEFCKESLQLYNNNPGYASLEQTAQANCQGGAPIINPPLANPVPKGQ